MPVLRDYRHFSGRHYETGAVHNILAYQGRAAPHTGAPLSEALLLGVSGGIAFGYFTFEYKGYDPQVALLTRNTFDPLETLLNRLGIARDVLQTASAETAYENLVNVLEGGHPALVWLDKMSLPYTVVPYDERNWMTGPVVVYGVDGDTAYVADRSAQPLTVTREALDRARGRVKKDRFRILVLDTPQMDKLSTAVHEGIWQCIRLYTEAPPRGRKESFGLAGLAYWAEMLTNTRNRQSWARYFPPGRRMLAALAGGPAQPGAWDWIKTWGTADGAERGVYADFLDEAAGLLGEPRLEDVAVRFREAAAVWNGLAQAMLPDTVSPLGEIRALKAHKHHLFIEQGDAALDEIREVNAQLELLRATASEAFPLDEAEAAAFREALAERVRQILTIERDAVAALQAAMH